MTTYNLQKIGQKYLRDLKVFCLNVFFILFAKIFFEEIMIIALLID